MNHILVVDDEQAIAELVHRAVQECDFVITSGGASAGDYDYVTAWLSARARCCLTASRCVRARPSRLACSGVSPTWGFQVIRPRRM